MTTRPLTKIDRIKRLRQHVDRNMRLTVAARIVDAGDDDELVERTLARETESYTGEAGEWVKREDVTALEARVRELEADPRRALTADDLEWAAQRAAHWAIDARVTPVWAEGMVARSARFNAALAAVSAEDETQYLPDSVLSRRLDEARAAVNSEKEADSE